MTVSLFNKTKAEYSPRTFIRNNRTLLGTVGALLLMIVIQAAVIGFNEGSFSAILPKLYKSWLNILRNNMYTGVIAIGMCLVIVSGGIDLSVGSLTCAVGAVLMYLIDGKTGLLQRVGITGVPAYIAAVIAALAFGLLLGEINGFLSAHGKIPPFVATLGTMKIFRSVTQQATSQFSPVVPSGFRQLASFKTGGEVLLPIIYWVAIVLIMHLVFRKTPFGKKIVAVGSNEQAASYAGIKTASVKRRVYALCGLMCAVAAIVYVARIGSMDFANAGSGYEMEAIAAAVVGGTAMSGGRGSIAGAFLGMLIVGAINNILNMLGVPTFLCDAVRGAIIILAVLVQLRNTGGGIRSLKRLLLRAK